MFALFTEMFLYTIVVPVLPFALESRAGVAPEDTQYWVSILLSVYGAALFFGSPPVSWLADRTETRQMPFLLGLVVLAGGSLLLCLGTNLPALIIARVLQGFASSVVWIIGFAILADTFEQQELGVAVGFAVLGWTVATVIGPVLGGVVYAAVGYYSVFYMSFGLIALDVILRLVMIEHKVAARWLSDDGTSSPSSAIEGTDSSTEKGNSVAPTPQAPELPSLTEPANARSSPAVVTGDSKAAAPQSRSPMLSLLRSPRILLALWGFVIQALTLMSFDGILPLHVNRVFGWNSQGAGLIFLAIVIPTFFSPLVGKFVDSSGRGRWVAATGYGIACPTLILLRYVDEGVSVAGTAPGSTNQAVLLAALLFIVGAALTIVIVPALEELTIVVDEREKAQPGIFGPRGAYARAYGLMNMCWAAGAVVGPIMAGEIVRQQGWGIAMVVIGVLNGATMLIVIAFGLWERRQPDTQNTPGDATSTQARDEDTPEMKSKNGSR